MISPESRISSVGLRSFQAPLTSQFSLPPYRIVNIAVWTGLRKPIKESLEIILVPLPASSIVTRTRSSFVPCRIASGTSSSQWRRPSTRTARYDLATEERLVWATTSTPDAQIYCACSIGGKRREVRLTTAPLRQSRYTHTNPPWVVLRPLRVDAGSVGRAARQ